jgi:hypothetical protein
MTKNLGSTTDWRRCGSLATTASAVRLSLPGLPVEGAPRPVHINIDFDASVVDLIIDRLTMLRLR